MIDKSVLQEVWEEIENSNKTLFKTGFQDLDMIMGLNEGKGALVTIGARPAMGKTTFMLSIIENCLKNNKKVHLFSLEMSINQVIKKLLSINSQVSLFKLKHLQLNEKDFEKLVVSMENLAKFDLNISDITGITVSEIEEKIKNDKPDVVFIDYLQLIIGKNKFERYKQIEDIMQELKRIAKEYGVLIFMSSQLSRALESRFDKRPMLSDLRESGAIENYSDIVIFIYRDEYYKYTDDNAISSKGETELIVAKNKFGACGTCYITFKADIPKFYDRSEHFDIF